MNKKRTVITAILISAVTFAWMASYLPGGANAVSPNGKRPSRLFASRAAKASGHISIWLYTRSGTSTDSEIKLQHASTAILKLLGNQIESLPTDFSGPSGNVKQFTASGWFPKLSEPEREAVLNDLIDTWTSDIRLQITSNSGASLISWPEANLRENRVTLYQGSQSEIRLLPNSLLGGNASPFDGSNSSRSNLIDPFFAPSSVLHSNANGIVPESGFQKRGETSAAQALRAPKGNGKSQGKILVFDPAAIDTSIDPCNDFYQYSCGSWLKNNPIPGDHAYWGRDSLLEENTRNTLRDILQEAGRTHRKRDPDVQKIGDFYDSCMDEKKIEKKGAAPLKPQFKRIAAMNTRADFASAIASLQGSGMPALFSFTSDQDAGDASQEIAEADQGGISLPERKYYLDDNFKKELTAYSAHVRAMFRLLGEQPQRAATDAATVVTIETALAKISMSIEDRRDPKKVYHKMSLQEFMKLSPAFDWKRYFFGIRASSFQEINVMVPDFFTGLNVLISETPLRDWKVYLRWQALHGQADLLSSAFVDENFNFFGKTLSGAKELEPRWKRCVKQTDHNLGEALGRIYVDRIFGKDEKVKTLQMVHEIEQSMETDLDNLPWMTEDTKKQALVKLRGVANKIGYPDKWRDYSKLRIARGDAFGNGQRSASFEFQRQLAKIGKPVDRAEWDMTPPTVNAYYNPQMNNINFPAGILQPPFYDKDTDEVENLASIGAIIGHELTHAFDDQGRQFDAVGNLRDWWTEADAKKFGDLAKGFVDQYSGYAVKDPQNPSKDIPLNGELTLGENIADNGGLRLSYMSLFHALSPIGSASGQFTNPQRFFITYGQSWCANETDELAKRLVATDPHSPARFRVNGVVSNMPEFQQAFQCPKDSPMVRATPNRVW